MKFWKLNSWKRMAILSTTMVGSILAITLGSVFYTSKHINKSIEYGGGAEYLVKINTNDKNANQDEIAQEIYQRIDRLGIAGINVNTEKTGAQNFIRVTYPGAITNEQIANVENEITKKSHLVFTDIWGNPLFTSNGNFNTKLNSSVKSTIRPMDSVDWNHDTNVPLISSSARSFLNQNGKYDVQVDIQRTKIMDWINATKYISSLPEKSNKILTWLNLGDFIQKLKNTPGKTIGQNLWDESGHDPYKAAHINNNIEATLRNNSNYLLSNAGDFLISDSVVKQPVFVPNFVISGDFSASDSINLAKKLNFGASNYSLETKFAQRVEATYGNNAFQKAIIAAIVVFSFIAIFLIVNYGLLGALSTISISLFMFITLTLFSVMRGEYSPESIAALIIGIGMSVDANIITFERLKNEIYQGNNLIKSHKIANRKSFWTIFDANITTLIIAIVLFYFGTRNIVGLSVTLMLTIFLTLIIMLGFTQLTSTLLIRTGKFDNKLHLLGIKPKLDVKIQEKFDNFDYVKTSKYFSIFSLVIIGTGAIVLTVLSAIAGSLAGGFNLSSEFKEGAVYQFNVNSSGSTSLDEAKKILFSAGFTESNFIYGYSNNIISSIKVISENGNIIPSLDPNLLKSTWGQNYNFSITSSAVAQQLIKDALIAFAIAIGGIIVYTLIRFKWTYALAAIIALVHDGLMVLSMFIFTRMEVSPIFVAGLLAIFGYSINDTIVTFDRIREKMRENKNMNLDAMEIKTIANNAVADTIKRSLLTSLTTIIAVLVLMCFGNATKIEFNFAMLVGLIFGTYSSIFIATYLWTKFETLRQNGIKNREKNNFWNVSKIDEQLIKGINDFKH